MGTQGDVGLPLLEVSAGVMLGKWRESSHSGPDYVRSVDLEQLWFEKLVRF